MKPKSREATDPILTEHESQEPDIEMLTPSLTGEQKLAIRDAQVQVLKLREQSRQLIEQSQKIEKDIVSYINQRATDLKVNGTIFSFNVDTLEFNKIVKPVV